MPTYSANDAPLYPAHASEPRAEGAPWQIWIVVVMLGLEGLGNLLSIPNQPAALTWLLFKILFITGLLMGWRFVFALFLVMAAIHVIGFLQINLFVSFLNLLTMVLVFCSRSYFFGPRKIAG